MNTADTNNDNPELTKLVAEIEQRRSKINEVIRELAAARAAYCTTDQSVELCDRMIALERNARTLEDESKLLMDQGVLVSFTYVIKKELEQLCWPGVLQ